jgi:serine/threonine-protein kinase
MLIEVVEPGAHIGRYRLEAVLGRGGMGEVFRAWDEVLQRRVAIKVLRAPDGAAESRSSGTPIAPSVRRVIREARMAAALRHPNVVAIFDVGEQDGFAYIVMEYLRGASLRALIGRAAVTPEERVRWLGSVASALAVAHRQGLVHRDVKPDNVLVDENLVAKVLDFGIARRDESETDERDRAAPGMHAPPERPSTAPPSVPPGAQGSGTLGTLEEGRVVGTPGYMAPEQIRREPIDGRADQFAWGVTAYELLTSKLPWPADAVGRSLLETVLTHEPAPLDAAALGVAPAVTATIHRALSKARADRFATMDELLEALGLARERARSLPPLPPQTTAIRVDGADTSIGGAPTELARATTDAKAPVAHTRSEEAPRGQGKRGRKLALALVGGTLVGLAPLVLFWLQARHAGAPPPPTPTGFRPRLGAPAPSESASSSARGSSLRPRNVRRLTMEYGCQEFASITPDGATVVYDANAGRDVHVYALDVDSGKQRTLTEGSGWQWAPSVSPDGREIAYLRTENDVTAAYLMPLSGDVGKRPLRKVAEGSVRPRYSPDGRAVWVGQGRSPTRVDRETLAVTRTLTPPSGFRGIAVIEVPDGRALVHLAQVEGHDSGGIVRFEAVASGGADAAAGGAAQPTWLTHDGVDEALLLMPDARSIVAPKMSRALRGQLTRFPIDGSEVEGIALPEVMPTKGFARSHGRSGADGRGEPERIVWSTCAERSELVTLTPATGSGGAAGPTGPTGPTGDAGAAGNPAERRAETKSLLGQTDWTDESPAWIPGTSKLVVASDRSQGRGLWVLDMAKQEAPRQIPIAGTHAVAPVISRDGTMIVYVSPADGLFAVPLDGHAPPRRLTSGADDASPCLSTDGATVYFQTLAPDRRPRIASVRLEPGGTPGSLDALGTRPATTVASTAPVVVREHAARPSLGARDGELLFLATDAEAAEGLPMVLDLKTGVARELSPAARGGRYVQVRLSPDGTRAGLLSSSMTEVVELDLTKGIVRQRYVSGVDEAKDVAYLRDELLVSRQVWSGGIWIAEDGP